MRKGSFELTLDRFDGQMKEYLAILDLVFDSPPTDWSKQMKRDVHEAFVFKVVSLWEVMVEDLLIDCLNRDSSQYAEFMGLFRLRQHLPRQECQALIEGLGFFDFKSVENMKTIATNILVPLWNPFVAISQKSSRKINEFVAFRNYLAHYSTPAQRRVSRIYMRYKLKNFLEPGAFLMARPRGASQTRYGDYFDAYSDAVRTMRKALRSSLRRHSTFAGG